MQAQHACQLGISDLESLSKTDSSACLEMAIRFKYGCGIQQSLSEYRVQVFRSLKLGNPILERILGINSKVVQTSSPEQLSVTFSRLPFINSVLRVKTFYIQAKKESPTDFMWMFMYAELCWNLIEESSRSNIKIDQDHWKMEAYSAYQACHLNNDYLPAIYCSGRFFKSFWLEDWDTALQIYKSQCEAVIRGCTLSLLSMAEMVDYFSFRKKPECNPFACSPSDQRFKIDVLTTLAMRYYPDRDYAENARFFNAVCNQNLRTSFQADQTKEDHYKRQMRYLICGMNSFVVRSDREVTLLECSLWAEKLFEEERRVVVELSGLAFTE